ncbi:hypothetical protein H4R19_002011 [Coemansia spiralis]|nr:hypothetical protein H4R19_002011 [Coemansia spiralis]
MRSRDAVAWLALAGVALGGCESPASFKVCLEQTRAEVDICGINMTCRCERQESVVRCYEKCGDDKYYRRLKLGEKGQQQIFCSQKRRDEPVDLPVLAAAADAEPAQKHDDHPRSTPSPAPRPAERRASRSDRDADRALAADIDGAAPGPAIRAHLLAAAAVLAAAL